MRHRFYQSLLIALLLASSGVTAQDLLLIANVPDGSQFSEDYAWSLLRGDKKNWDGGIGAQVALPSRKSQNYDEIAQTLLGFSGKSMQRLWFRLVFSGRVNPPTYLDSDADIVRFVMETEGAVALITQSKSDMSDLITIKIAP